MVQAADRIVIDGTSPQDYSVDCAEAAFVLGMVVAKEQVRQRSDGSDMKVFYDEQHGYIGMYGGAVAGWEIMNWRDQLNAEIAGWV